MFSRSDNLQESIRQQWLHWKNIKKIRKVIYQSLLWGGLLPFFQEIFPPGKIKKITSAKSPPQKKKKRNSFHLKLKSKGASNLPHFYVIPQLSNSLHNTKIYFKNPNKYKEATSNFLLIYSKNKNIINHFGERKILGQR